METIFIPRVSVLTKDKDIFSNLANFTAVAGYVPTITAPICETNSIKKESNLSKFLRTLRNYVLRPSRGGYDIIKEEENECTLFSPEIRSELTERKKALVQLIKKHETALLALRDARIQCWKSKARLQEYQLIVETQKSALMYNQHEKKIRTAALQNMELLLDKWMTTHGQDQVSFKTKFLKEIKYREKIHRISADIKIDILRHLEQAIRTLMNQNKQNISDRDIGKFSRQLYSKTCRAYIFGLVQNSPSQKEWIAKPKYEHSVLNGTDTDRKIKKTAKWTNYAK